MIQSETATCSLSHFLLDLMIRGFQATIIWASNWRMIEMLLGICEYLNLERQPSVYLLSLWQGVYMSVYFSL